MQVIEKVTKMRDLGIFKNNTSVDTKRNGTLMMHQDDMTTYNSWFLIEHHEIDEIVYRGLSENAPSEFKERLDKIGNPKNIIVTFSTKDTY